jgi:hypothetical protein
MLNELASQRRSFDGLVQPHSKILSVDDDRNAEFRMLELQPSARRRSSCAKKGRQRLRKLAVFRWTSFSLPENCSLFSCLISGGHSSIATLIFSLFSSTSTEQIFPDSTKPFTSFDPAGFAIFAIYLPHPPCLARCDIPKIGRGRARARRGR